MQENQFSTLLQTRLLVGYLGEKAQFGWWPTAFYDSSARVFLEPVFAKTTRNAQYQAVLEAARRIHDEHLSVGAFHLFRLPEEIEQDLQDLLQFDVGEVQTAELGRGQGHCVEALRSLAGGLEAKGEGPIALGSFEDFGKDGSLAVVAATYLAAFTGGHKAYPYWASES